MKKAAPVAEAKAAPTKADAPAADEEDDGFNFDDEEEDDQDARDARIAQKASEHAAKLKASGKDKKEAGRSTVVFDVKPTEADTDLDALLGNLKAIEMAGLVWGAAEKIPVAFGVKKLRILCTIVDELVSVDALQEQIEAFEDDVQSVDIYSFNKV